MTSGLFSHVASSSGLGALGVNGSAFIIQLITFILAYLVLRRWAFGPILKVLRERRETIESGVKLGEQMRKERETLKSEVDKELHDARRQADSIIAEAQESGREVVKAAEDKARSKAEIIVKEAENRIEQEANRMRKQLEGEVVSLVSDATEAIIDEKVDTKKDSELIEKVLKERQTA
jgi:F-type H+-transporting ATPase subunit b